MQPIVIGKPSEVALGVVPLIATFGKAEIEYAAAILVRACHALGDEWRAVTWSEIEAVLKSDRTEGREPFASLILNPFFRPDVRALVDKGFARWTGGPGGPIEFTPVGLVALFRCRRTRPLRLRCRAMRSSVWAWRRLRGRGERGRG